MSSKRKTRIIMTGLVLCATLFSGCAAAIDSIDTQQQDAIMVAVFDASENEDYETLAQVVDLDVISEQDIAQMITGVSEYIEGTVTDYQKTGWYVNKSLSNGVQTTTMDLSYNVATDYDNYVVSMRLLQTGENDWKVIGFNVIRAEELKGNGAIINFEDFDVVQLLMLVLSAAELALMIIAIVVCAKSKVRRKALWIVLIVLLHTGVSLTLSPSGFHFNLWIMNVSLSSLQKFIDGTRVYNVLVPLGAILFLCLKKKLERRAEHHRMMQQYRQDYVPPYTPSEDPTEEVMPMNPQTPDASEQAGAEPPKDAE